MNYEKQLLNALMGFKHSKQSTIKNIAKAAGVNEATIYRWANGTYKPGMKIFNNIGNILGLEMVWVSKEYADIVSEKYCNINTETVIKNIKKAEIERLEAQLKKLKEETE